MIAAYTIAHMIQTPIEHTASRANSIVLTLLSIPATFVIGVFLLDLLKAPTLTDMGR